MNDNSAALLTSSAGLALVGYLAVSGFMTGPLVAKRMAAKSGWDHICASKIRDEVSSKQEPVTRMPKIGCMEIFGGWFGRAGKDYCDMHGGLFENNPINKAVEQFQSAKEAANRKRFEYAASRANDRCACALTTTIESRRIPFAIYAGTLRLVEPSSVTRFESDLTANLNSQLCVMKGE